MLMAFGKNNRQLLEESQHLSLVYLATIKKT